MELLIFIAIIWLICRKGCDEQERESKQYSHQLTSATTQTTILHTKLDRALLTKRQENIRTLKIGDSLKLEQETDNKHLPNAIQVFTMSGLRIGYLSDEAAEKMLVYLQAKEKISVKVEKIETISIKCHDGDKKYLQVRIDIAKIEEKSMQEPVQNVVSEDKPVKPISATNYSRTSFTNNYNKGSYDPDFGYDYDDDEPYEYDDEPYDYDDMSYDYDDGPEPYDASDSYWESEGYWDCTDVD